MEQCATNTISNEQLFAKLCEVQHQLALNENSRELWTTKEVAEYFKVTTSHASRFIMVDPRFPAPIDIPSRTGGNSKNLYIAGEVVQYAMKYRKRKNRL